MTQHRKEAFTPNQGCVELQGLSPDPNLARQSKPHPRHQSASTLNAQHIPLSKQRIWARVWKATNNCEQEHPMQAQNTRGDQGPCPHSPLDALVEHAER